MRVKLSYGRTGLEVELPDERVVRTLAYKEADPLPEPRESLAQLLANPMGSPPLSELAKGKRSACILICDITRPVPNETILTPVLETLEAAKARDAPILAELLGYACTNDADDLLRPSTKGAAECMRKTLQRSNISLLDIGYVNAHGTGTIANDETEARALREIFGEYLDRVGISADQRIGDSRHVGNVRAHFGCAERAVQGSSLRPWRAWRSPRCVRRAR